MRRWRRDEDGNPAAVDLPLHVVIDANRRIVTHGLDLPKPKRGLRRVTVADGEWEKFEQLGTHHLAEDGTVVVTPPSAQEQAAIDAAGTPRLHVQVREADRTIVAHGTFPTPPADHTLWVSTVDPAERATFEREGDKLLAADGTITVLPLTAEQQAAIAAERARADQHVQDAALIRQAAAEDPRFAALARHLGIDLAP